MAWTTDDIPDLHGKVAVITGANGGLGLASAKALAGKGAHVVMATHNQKKATDAREGILLAHPAASLENIGLDLGSLASVEEAADQIIAAHDPRIVTLSSTAQHMGHSVNPADPHMRERYDPWRMYGQSKLAMRHLAMGLQERFDRAGVDAKALAAQPGLTNSDLQSTTRAHGAGGLLGAMSESWAELTGMSTDRGALSQLRAATDPDAPGGGFYGPLFVTNGPPIGKPLLRPASGKAIATLWEVAERETGVRINVGGNAASS